MDLIKIYAGILLGLTLVEIIAIFFASPENTQMSEEDIELHAKNLRKTALILSPLLLRCLEII